MQNSVGLKYKFYKSNVEGIFVQERLQSVNKIGQQVYLWRGEQQGALLPVIITLSCDFEKYSCLKYSYTQMCRWVGIFQKLHDSIAITLLATGDECHLDFSPKSCAYPTFVTIDPLELKIISILLLDIITCQCYSASLSLAIVHFLLLVGKNYCLSLFLLKNVWFINSKYFPFWKGCAVCPAQLTFVTLYLSHHVVTAWHRTDLLNPCNE